MRVLNSPKLGAIGAFIEFTYLLFLQEYDYF